MIPRPIPTIVTWSAIRDLLDLGDGSAALPTMIRCPGCAGRLRIFPTTTCGAWHYCLDCKQVSGDLLELAARIWEVPIPEAMRKLLEADLSLPVDEIREYPDAYYRRRQRIATTWQAARRYVTSQAVTLHRLLSCIGYLYFDRREASRFFGALPLNEVHRLLVPYAITTTSMGRSSRHDRLRLGRGPGWDDVLVFPFENAPGRICGFEFIGRKGGPTDHCDWTCQSEGDAGLFGLGMLAEAMERHGSQVVVAPSVLDHLRLQLRVAACSPWPLPLVTCWHGEKGSSNHVWQFLKDARSRIFWAKKIDAAVIAEAIRQDGKLVILDAKPGDEGQQLYFQLIRQSRPWPMVLSGILDRIPDGQAEALLADLEQQGVLVGDIAAACPKHAERIDALRRPLPCRIAEANGYRIAERNGMWYDVSSPGTSTLILNGVIRIDRIESDGSVRFCKGNLFKDDKRIPFYFRVPANSRLITPLNELCKREGIAPLQTRAPWRGRLTQIACLFQSPDRIEISR